MSLHINDDFIREWEPKYADKGVGDDDQGYAALVKSVAEETKQAGTISNGFSGDLGMEGCNAGYSSREAG